VIPSPDVIPTVLLVALTYALGIGAAAVGLALGGRLR